MKRNKYTNIDVLIERGWTQDALESIINFPQQNKNKWLEKLLTASIERGHVQVVKQIVDLIGRKLRRSEFSKLQNVCKSKNWSTYQEMASHINH